MKKTGVLTVFSVLLLAITLVFISLPQTMNASTPERPGPWGLEPVYDSGWFLMADGWDFLYHGGGWRPLNMTVLVSRTAGGVNHTEAIPNPDPWCYGGYLQGGASCDWIGFYWGQHVGYSQESSQWYNGGEHYARVLVYSATHAPGDPPCR